MVGTSHSASHLRGLPGGASRAPAVADNRSVPDTVPIVAVVGPTAAGKSELALDVALALGGEVVNADAMQVYRGMDIGTAKLPPSERRGVPHHLLDVLDVGEPATVAEFQGWAREAIGDCRARGVAPIVVGGSALYVRAVLDEFEFPGTDPDIRASIEAELASVGSEVLHRRLASLDPAAAGTILPTNGRRIVRALEVIELTGRPFAAQAARAHVRVRRRRPGRSRRAARRARRPNRGAGRADVEGRPRRRGPQARARRPARRPHRVARARVSAGVGVPGWRLHRARAFDATIVGDAPVRSPPADLVPPRPAHPLAPYDDPDLADASLDAVRSRA